MRRAYEMSPLAVIYHAAGEEVVAAGRQEQPQGSREKHEREEAAATMASTAALVARDMARYQANRDAARAAEEAAARARWDDALAEGQACCHSPPGGLHRPSWEEFRRHLAIRARWWHVGHSTTSNPDHSKLATTSRYDRCSLG
jgi:hypothetical protein